MSQGQFNQNFGSWVDEALWQTHSLEIIIVGFVSLIKEQSKNAVRLSFIIITFLYVMQMN